MPDPVVAPAVVAPVVAPAVVAPAVVDKPWHDGLLDAEHVGVLQAKNWHDKDVKTVAAEALKSYRAAEKHLGVPADQLLRFNPNDQNAMAAVYTKLGAPAKAEEYDLSNVKFSDGSVIEGPFADKLKASAFKFHIPKEAFVGFATELVSSMDETEKQDATIDAGKLESERAAIRVSWGNNLAANTFIAQQGAVAAGFDKDILTSLEKVAGYEKTMNALLALGRKLGEDKYVQGNPNLNNGIMTVEQAQAEKKRLMADTTFRQRAGQSGSSEWDQITALNRMISGYAG